MEYCSHFQDGQLRAHSCKFADLSKKADGIGNTYKLESQLVEPANLGFLTGHFFPIRGVAFIVRFTRCRRSRMEVVVVSPTFLRSQLDQSRSEPEPVNFHVHRPMISEHPAERYFILMRLTDSVTVVRIEGVMHKVVRVVRAAVQLRLVATVLHLPVWMEWWKGGGPEGISESGCFHGSLKGRSLHEVHRKQKSRVF